MKEKKRNDISVNLLDLQNKVKRDPSLYYDEFFSHYEYYKEVLKLFMMNPTTYNEELADLIAFLAQVSACYKKELADYPQDLINVLRENFQMMNSDMRMSFVKSLILLRTRGMVEAVDLIPLFFRLLNAKDKLLRKLLQIHIISDVKRMNAKHKNVKLNTTLQNLMFEILRNDHNDKDDFAIPAKMSLDIMIELYKKRIWNNEKTVNVIAKACLSKVNKIKVAAHQFFLGSDEVDEEKDSSDSEKEDDTPNVKDVMAANKVNKKSRRRMKILKRTKQALKRSKKKKNKEVFDFSAIHLLHDSQGFAEKLLKMLDEKNERYEIKMMVMNLVSRLIGVNKLQLLNYYALLLQFLKPRQRDVTKILTFAAQAAHENVPPDDIEPVVKEIAYNFVSERNSFEAMTVGINAIREICARCPFAISTDLLQDIAEYKNYKNKNVAMAARSIIQLYRKINPHMLTRKFKSRPTEASKELDSVEYGASKAKSFIPGSEVLPLEPSTEDNNEQVVTKIDEDDSDDGWIDVSHSEDEINIKSDDDDKDDEVENEEDSSEDEIDEEEDGEEENDLMHEDEKENNSVTEVDKNNKDSSKVGEESDEEEDEQKEAAEFANGKKRKVHIEVNEKDIGKVHKKPKTDKKHEVDNEEKEDKANSSVAEIDKSDKVVKKVSFKNIKNAKENRNATDNEDKQKAMLVSQSRILSQEEFKMLKAVQIAKEVQFRKGKKRNVDVEVNYDKEIVSLRDIEKLHKRPRSDKATRLATALEGREGREKFGKKNKKNPNSGKTQKEHNKRKAFMMIKHKVRSKQKRSFKDKQISLRNALLKRKRNK